MGGRKIELDHPILPWLIEAGAGAIRRYRVGADGKTAYERIKGKRSRVSICEFGEAVMYKPWKTKAQQRQAEEERIGDMDPRWRDGLYLGIAERSGEILWVHQKG